MYIWIGCKLPSAFEKEIRNVCLRHNAHIGLDTSGFSLPQHISLKISFDAGDRAEAILAYLADVLQAESRFYVNLSPIEQAGSILWIPVAENARLQHLHDMLDAELENRYGIPQHGFDKCFRFHSTLFLGEHAAVEQMQRRLKDIFFPDPLLIDTFLLGTSPNGKSGSYRVVREIKL